jgi:hypothetical protein
MHILLLIIEVLAVVNLSAVSFFAYRYFTATVPPPSLPEPRKDRVTANLKVMAIR